MRNWKERTANAAWCVFGFAINHCAPGILYVERTRDYIGRKCGLPPAHEDQSILTLCAWHLKVGLVHEAVESLVSYTTEGEPVMRSVAITWFFKFEIKLSIQEHRFYEQIINMCSFCIFITESRIYISCLTSNRTNLLGVSHLSNYSYMHMTMWSRIISFLWITIRTLVAANKCG